MKLGYLLDGIDCTSYNPEIDVKSICYDSRKAKPECAFVCIHSGESGLRYLAEARDRGAFPLICERSLCRYVPFSIGCDDTRRTLSHMYNRLCGEPSKKLRLIAVTGTNGKTTTAFMLYTLLARMGKRAAFIGTTGCLCMGAECTPNDVYASDRFRTMTTPDPEFLYPVLQYMSQSRIEFVVMEVSSHSIKQHKISPLEFEYGIFTNLSSEHMDFHHGMQDYFSTKLSLFEKCKYGIFNADDEYSIRAYEACGCTKRILCSAAIEADYYASKIMPCGDGGVTYLIEHDDRGGRVSSLMPGMPGVYDSMLAISVCAELFGGIENILPYASKLPSAEGRMQKISSECSDVSVFIDYAHTPAALEALLKSVKSFRKNGQRIILLFGCGGDRDRTKRPVMGKIASQEADLTYITSDNSRTERAAGIIRDIVRGFDRRKPHRIIRDRKLAIESAILEALPGDIIILAGKGHEKYEITEQGRIPFDERAIALEALRKRSVETNN
jgi:UDP-N-acetylmuramoyl-L-alanyl-D-glutamate--2,6-diaminopimelate ligase